MEFLVAGASAVQIGTANFYNPGLSAEIVQQLPASISQLGGTCPADIIGSLQVPNRPAAPCPVSDSES